MTTSYIVNDQSNPIPVSVAPKRQELIESIRNKSVNANGTGWLLVDKDVSKYAFLYAYVITADSHPYVLYYKASGIDPATSGFSFPANIIIDSEATRSVSDWIEVKAETIIAAIENHDTESAHVYDVDIYGVM